MRYIVNAVYVADHEVKIRFDDGSIKMVDLGPYLDGPIFEPLKDPDFFRRMTVNHDIETIVWPNGADFSPDFLYEIGVSVEDSEFSSVREDEKGYERKGQ